MIKTIVTYLKQWVKPTKDLSEIHSRIIVDKSTGVITDGTTFEDRANLLQYSKKIGLVEGKTYGRWHMTQHKQVRYNLVVWSPTRENLVKLLTDGLLPQIQSDTLKLKLDKLIQVIRQVDSIDCSLDNLHRNSFQKDQAREDMQKLLDSGSYLNKQVYRKRW